VINNKYIYGSLVCSHHVNTSALVHLDIDDTPNEDMLY